MNPPRRATALLLMLLGIAAFVRAQAPQQPPPQPVKLYSGMGSLHHTIPPLSLVQAMKMFYGNYDGTTRTSSMPNPPKNDLNAFSFDAEQITVSPLFQAFTQEAGIETFVLVTYGLPLDESYDCHACAPVVGMAVFSCIRQQWVMTASNQAVTQAGAWGKPETNIHLVKIGANHFGVAINNSGSGNGETTTVLMLLVPWNNTVDVGLERIIADDDAGMCGELSTLPCYSNRRRITFSLDSKGEFYRIKLSLTGTDYVDASNSRSGTPNVLPKRRVSGVEILTLKDGRYVQVSRSGDLTNLDQAVADREHLK